MVIRFDGEMRVRLLPMILTCVALGSSAGLLLLLLFDTGKNREIGIFVASFGLPTIPVACVYGALELANQWVDRKRRNSKFTDLHEQIIVGAFGLAGLILGMLGAAVCLYILFVSITTRSAVQG